MPNKVIVGVVTSDKSPKTCRVDVNRLVKHPKYGKYIRRRTVCYVHDEQNEAGLGDTVEIVECRPRSKTKRWELVRIIAKNSEVDLAALKAAQESDEPQQPSEPQPSAAEESAAGEAAKEDTNGGTDEGTGAT